MKIQERLMLRTFQAGECLLWTGYLNRDGYGRIGVGGSTQLVHRVAYTEWVGAIPDGAEVDHLCKVRRCVNPKHLEAVTHAENMRRIERGTDTHCRMGHAYTDENTYVWASNGRSTRRCRECKRAGDRDRDRARRQGGTQ